MMSQNLFGTQEGQGVLERSCSFTEKMEIRAKARMCLGRMLELSGQERSWKKASQTYTGI